MVNEHDPATQGEQVEEVPGSEAVETSGGTPDNEDVGNGTDLNPKAFKGLQRRLSAKDREIAQAQARIEELQSQAQSGAMSVDDVVRLVRPVIDSIKTDNPELARNLAVNIAQTIDARNNMTAQQKLDAIEARQKAEAEEADILDDLQALAEDLGVDPDDDGLDYGNSSMSLRERMKLIRQTAKELSKAPAPTAPKPTSSTGAAMSGNGGTPPAPKSKPTEYTKADLDRELAAYVDTKKRSHLEKAGEIKTYLVAQAEGRLTS